MPYSQAHATPMGAASGRVREREIRRQLRHNHARTAAIRGRTAVRNYVATRTTALARQFLETLLGSLLGFLLIAELLAHLAGVREVDTFSAFGLVYSLQSTYYKYKLAADPEFKIPSCRCARRGPDGTEGVLQSRHSAILGVPNSVFAVAFFLAVPVLTAGAGSRTALPLAVVAVAASGQLLYVMLMRLRRRRATRINNVALCAPLLPPPRHL